MCSSGSCRALGASMAMRSCPLTFFWLKYSLSDRRCGRYDHSSERSAPGKDVGVVRCDLGRPHDALVFVMGLDDGLDRPPDADSVASADEWLARAIVGQERRVHLLGVVGPVGEDVSHFHATLDGERPNPTLRTQISRADVRGIDSFALEIATDQHVAKVGVLLVRAGDVGTVLDTLVHQKTRLEAD